MNRTMKMIKMMIEEHKEEVVVTVRCVDCELDGWLFSILSCRHVVNPIDY